MLDHVALGRAIQERRESVGITQDELADRAGIAYSTLSKIERGVVKNPSVFTIMALALHLGCSVEELLKSGQAAAPTTKSNSDTFLFIDMNGVLLHFYQRAFVRIAEECDIQSDKIESAFWHYNDTSNRGDMGIDEFNKVMAEHLGIKEFNWHDSYLAAVEPIQETHDFLREIIKTNRVGILTNTHAGLMAKVRDMNLIPDLDYACVVDSSEVHAIKPEPKIYEIAEEMAGAQGEQILFVDDSRTNLIAAERLGWRVMWFDEYRPADSVTRIKEALAQ